MSEVTAVPLRPIKKGSLTKLWTGIGLVAVVAIGLAWWGTASQVAMATPPAEFLAANAHRSGVVSTPSGLQYKVLTPGAGPKVTATDTVLANYEGKLVNDETFDASAQHGGPQVFQAGGAIPGFSEALQLMNAGAKYRFWIPPSLAYGPQDVPDPRTGKIAIPGNSVLVFDVEIVSILPQGGPAGMGGVGGSPHGDVIDRSQAQGGMR